MKKRLAIRADNDGKRTLLLSLFLLFGMCLGFLLAETISLEETAVLREYILHRSDDITGGPVRFDVLETLWAYVRGPLLLVLLSYCSTAVIPVLVVCTMRGLLLSYAVGSLVVALGQAGLELSIAVLGFRCLFTLPTTLYLSGGTLKVSLDPTADHRAFFWRRALYSAICLLIGAILEMTVSPLLLRYLMPI